jgi:hypothetical protein
MLKRTVDVEVIAMPEELASEFWSMCDSDQVRFFNELATLTEGHLPMQSQWITDCKEPELTPDARYVMQLIGDYAEAVK